MRLRFEFPPSPRILPETPIFPRRGAEAGVSEFRRRDYSDFDADDHRRENCVSPAFSTPAHSRKSSRAPMRITACQDAVDDCVNQIA